jgi:hypothetical protein
MKATITSRRPTYIKLFERNHDQLAETDVGPILKEGRELVITGLYKSEGGHDLIKLAGRIKVNGVLWPNLVHIWEDDWKGLEQVQAELVHEATEHSEADSPWVVHDVPYYIQNNNKNWRDAGSASSLRHGSVQCGLTSLAMMISMLKPWKWVQAQAKAHGEQFENYIASEMKRLGLRSTRADDHIKLLAALGIKATMRRNGTVADLCQVLEHFPTVIGMGYRGLGHFGCAIGYNILTGEIKIHDPFGERDYEHNTNGWVDICYEEGDEFGKGNVLTMEYLRKVWIDLGDDKGWFIEPDPGTLYYGGQDTPTAFRQAMPTGPQPQNSLLAPQEIIRTGPTKEVEVPAGQSLVIAEKDTLVKVDAVQSNELRDSQKANFKTGSYLIGIVSKADNGHIMVTKPDSKQIMGCDCVYLNRDHLKIKTPGGSSVGKVGAVLTDQDIISIAEEIGIPPAVFDAILQVEAAGSGFFPARPGEPPLPKILFEAHWFSDFTNSRYDDTHPDISSYSWNRELYKGGIAEWDRLQRAIQLDRTAALKSASWGLGQVMGFNHRRAGYETVEAMVEDMKRGEGPQARAMAMFIYSDTGLITAARRQDWHAFARLYNGEGYRLNNYHTKLGNAFNASTLR